jgi:hypothetical protein
MNIFEDRTIRNRLRSAFPRYFVNSQFEIIIYPACNSYFSLDGVETEAELKAKIIERLSREAIKGGSKQSQKYHLDGINSFLGTSFVPNEMEEIYTYLGNQVNHDKTLRFINSGYDMTILPAHDGGEEEAYGQD